MGLLVFIPGFAMGQETGTISGTVSDAQTEQRISTAQISLVGTAQGGLTTTQGRFTLSNVPAGDHTILVQRLGYSQVEVPVTVVAGETTTVDIELRQSAISLDELVVTGTADGARTRELGTSLAQISEDEIRNLPVRSPEDLLMGRATGVTVQLNSGQPGAGASIRLRGATSLSASRNQPLIYVDGVRIYNQPLDAAWASHQAVSPLNSVKANDIARVEIVRGAAATTLYGSEAAGGVIQIFTKQGRAGDPQWDAVVTTGFNSVGHVGPSADPTGLNLNDCAAPRRALLTSDWSEVNFADGSCPSSGSWLQRGPLLRSNLAVRGGSSDLTYFFSVESGREEGAIAPGEASDRGFRGNFSFRPRDEVNIALNTAYNRSNSTWVADGNNASGFLLNVARGPANNFKNSDLCESLTVDVCTNNGEILQQNNLNQTDHFTSGITSRWEPDGGRFRHRVTVGYDYVRTEGQTHYPFGFTRVPQGSLQMVDLTRTTVSLDYASSFDASFGGDFTNSLSWGGQMFQEERSSVYSRGDDFAGPGTPTVTSGARTAVTTDSRIRVVNPGVFAQTVLGWADRLFITGGVRADGHSAFGEDFGIQVYPKISGSWVISEESFWNVPGIDNFRLRAAIGEAGQAPDAFDAVRTWDPVAGDDGQPGFTPASLGNPELGPERTRELELGFETSLVEGRLTGEFTWYRQNTFDALVGVRPISSQGFLGRQLENVGQVRNQGFELALNSDLVRRPGLVWSARLNVSRNESEAVELTGEQAYSSWRNTIEEGYPVPSYIGPYVANPDEFAEPIIEEGFIGPSYPVNTIGVGTQVTFLQDFTLDVLGEFQGGHYTQNGVGYQNARRGVWAPCFDVQQKLQQAAQGDAGVLSDVTALDRLKCAIDGADQEYWWWIQEGDFFKLRTASLTWDLPEAYTPYAQSASITLSGRNLFTSTDYDGLDPEINEGGGQFLRRVEYYNLPPMRTFQLQVNLSF